MWWRWHRITNGKSLIATALGLISSVSLHPGEEKIFRYGHVWSGKKTAPHSWFFGNPWLWFLALVGLHVGLESSPMPVIPTGEVGEAARVGEKNKNGLRFLLSGVFKAGVGCNKNLGFTFPFLTWLDCNSPGNAFHLTVFRAESKISVFLPVPAESTGQIPISLNICNTGLFDFSWESCKTSLLTQSSKMLGSGLGLLMPSKSPEF